jgi:hypothetical protein
MFLKMFSRLQKTVMTQIRFLAAVLSSCLIGLIKQLQRNGDGFQNWTHRVGSVGSVGNSVNPTIANYLFECIKVHYGAGR